MGQNVTEKGIISDTPEYLAMNSSNQCLLGSRGAKNLWLWTSFRIHLGNRTPRKSLVYAKGRPLWFQMGTSIFGKSCQFIGNIDKTSRKSSFRNTAGAKIVSNKEYYQSRFFNNTTTPKRDPRIFRQCDVFMVIQVVTFLMKMYRITTPKFLGNTLVAALTRETLEIFNSFGWRLEKYTREPHIQYILTRWWTLKLYRKVDAYPPHTKNPDYQESIWKR